MIGFKSYAKGVGKYILFITIPQSVSLEFISQIQPKSDFFTPAQSSLTSIWQKNTEVVGLIILHFSKEFNLLSKSSEINELSLFPVFHVEAMRVSFGLLKNWLLHSKLFFTNSRTPLNLQQIDQTLTSPFLHPHHPAPRFLFHCTSIS